MTRSNARLVTLTTRMLSRHINTMGHAKCSKCGQAIIPLDIDKKIATKKNSNKTKWYHEDCAKMINLVEAVN